jgi:hypothetical protein
LPYVELPFHRDSFFAWTCFIKKTLKKERELKERELKERELKERELKERELSVWRELHIVAQAMLQRLQPQH